MPPSFARSLIGKKINPKSNPLANDLIRSIVIVIVVNMLETYPLQRLTSYTHHHPVYQRLAHNIHLSHNIHHLRSAVEERPAWAVATSSVSVDSPLPATEFLEYAPGARGGYLR